MPVLEDWFRIVESENDFAFDLSVAQWEKVKTAKTYEEIGLFLWVFFLPYYCCQPTWARGGGGGGISLVEIGVEDGRFVDSIGAKDVYGVNLEGDVLLLGRRQTRGAEATNRLPCERMYQVSRGLLARRSSRIGRRRRRPFLPSVAGDLGRASVVRIHVSPRLSPRIDRLPRKHLAAYGLHACAGNGGQARLRTHLQVRNTGSLRFHLLLCIPTSLFPQVHSPLLFPLPFLPPSVRFGAHTVFFFYAWHSGRLIVLFTLPNKFRVWRPAIVTKTNAKEAVAVSKDDSSWTPCPHPCPPDSELTDLFSSP